jgi:hypothetical protein
MKALFENLPAREQLRKIILTVPGGAAAISSIHAYRKRQLLKRLATTADVFTHHFEENYWGHKESRSGEGSSLEHTANIRREIPLLIESLGLKSILDAPCGDYNWFRHIERKADVRYTGGDIVAPLIAQNNAQFGNENTQFAVMNIIADPLPDADLWLCRDCLFHLPNADIHRALDRFRQSNICYLLTTTYPGCETNADILTGDFRQINLLIAPFSLPAPKQLIDDWVPGSAVRHLALWERSMLG